MIAFGGMSLIRSGNILQSDLWLQFISHIYSLLGLNLLILIDINTCLVAVMERLYSFNLSQVKQM